MARSTITIEQIPAAIEKLKRLLTRLGETQRSQSRFYPLSDGDIKRLVLDTNAVIDDIFGEGTTEARQDFRISTMWFYLGINNTARDPLQAFHDGFRRTLSTVEAALQRLADKLKDGATAEPNKILQAYKGLDMHKDIATAASALYEGDHYRNSVMDAVIALNNLVRLKSGEQRDGVNLMEIVFNPKKPILQFNPLADDSDREDQKGYMMMFSGAVSGLRNPRAHSLVVDDPERALEFIAFVSLLAKLVEGATRNR